MFKIIGHIVGNKDKNGLFAVNVPLLNIWTQCESISEAAEMAQGAIGLLMKSFTDGKLTISDFQIEQTGENFVITTHAVKEVVALALKQHRIDSLADVAKKMGKKSRNHYYRYEKGMSEPSLSQLRDLFQGIGYDISLSISPKNRE